MGLCVLRELIGDDCLHAGADAEAAVALREMHPCQTMISCIALRKVELVDLVGMRFFEQSLRYARAQIGFGDFLLGHNL